jgi:hypothetical protein
VSRLLDVIEKAGAGMVMMVGVPHALDLARRSGSAGFRWALVGSMPRES